MHSESPKLWIDPVALRKAKIVYTILAFLNAIGLRSQHFLSYQAVEQNVIGYRSYAEVDVEVLASNEFTPQLSSVTGSNRGVISEAAELNTYVRVAGFSNTLLQVQITDADYVSKNCRK